jgi:hypothetical protein
MTYIHIPVNFQNPTGEDFAKFCAAMEQLKTVPVQFTASLTTGSRPSCAGVALLQSGSHPIATGWQTPRQIRVVPQAD